MAGHRVRFFRVLGGVVLAGAATGLWVVSDNSRRAALNLLKALNLIREAQAEWLRHRPEISRHLLREAGNILHSPVNGPLNGQLFSALQGRGFDLLQSAIRQTPIVNNTLWVIVVLLAAIVALYWFKESSIDRLDRERRELRERLLAITASWSLARVNPGAVKDAVTNILDQLLRYSDLEAVEVYRIYTDRSRDALVPYCKRGRVLPEEVFPVPGAFLAPALGALGQAILDRERVWYSGDEGENGFLLPRARLRRVAVFPLLNQEAVFGVVMVKGTEPGWIHRHQDLLTVVAQEIGILLSNAELQEETRRLEMFQELARVRSELLANVSHELRTPLGLIRGYAETLRHAKGRLDRREEDEFLQVIHDESLQLEQLIDNFLRMSTIEAVGIQLHLASVRYGTLVDRLLHRLVPADRLRVHVLGDLEVSLWVDLNQMLEALGNLVHNALKYSKHKVTVEGGQNGPQYFIRVQDQGPGVLGHDLTNIFERFYRSPQHAQSMTRGSGLGLSIAKKIAEAHGGTVRAENLKPRGFSVVIEWPVMESASSGKKEFM